MWPKKEERKRLASSTEDVSGVGKPTPEYPESDLGGEEEQVREMDRKEAENALFRKRSTGTAKVPKSRSSKIEAFHQSSLFEVPSPISGNIKRQQVGFPSAQMCTSEAEIKKENLEMDGGEEGQGREAETSLEPLEMEGTEDQVGQEIVFGVDGAH
ncbi:hypothetical protein Q7C36_022711 [Tachysurus vachellii]|uniref:Uncharacterized protein n=1 Tax=Tachysurus vachellii TaxID=175792 RepID=A0AA88IM11_TACVA|nr:hypothetical protein Q7C36_022711 [Tachysurus vachellii]